MTPECTLIKKQHFFTKAKWVKTLYQHNPVRPFSYRAFRVILQGDIRISIAFRLRAFASLL
jgi:hypothetical protein